MRLCSNTATQQVISTLEAAVTNLTAADVSIDDESGSPLPPASLRGLLHEMRDTNQQQAFGGVVLTDHGPTQYTNTYASWFMCSCTLPFFHVHFSIFYMFMYFVISGNTTAILMTATTWGVWTTLLL